MSDLKVSMPVSAVEMQEYLFSESLVKVAARCEQEKHNVTDWLLMNGVSIPADLLTDEAHKPVGEQVPDTNICRPA